MSSILCCQYISRVLGFRLMTKRLPDRKRRSSTLQIRFTTAERAVIKMKARVAAVTISAYVREKALL